MDEAPTTPITPTHQPNGCFAKGNKFGKGNPVAKRMQEHRKVWLDAITPLEMQAVKQAVFNAAVDGDVMAQRLWLEYSIGKVKTSQDETENEDAEAMVIAPPEALKTA